MKKFLDFIASLCFEFNVDWDTDFEDDSFVQELRAKEEAARRSRITMLPNAPLPRKAV